MNQGLNRRPTTPTGFTIYLCSNQWTMRNSLYLINYWSIANFDTLMSDDLASYLCVYIESCVHVVISWMCHQSYKQHLCCDQAKWVGTRKYCFWDTPKQKDKFTLFSIVSQNLQLLISLELINPFSWGFQLNVTLKSICLFRFWLLMDEMFIFLFKPIH